MTMGACRSDSGRSSPRWCRPVGDRARHRGGLQRHPPLVEQPAGDGEVDHVRRDSLLLERGGGRDHLDEHRPGGGQVHERAPQGWSGVDEAIAAGEHLAAQLVGPEPLAGRLERGLVERAGREAQVRRDPPRPLSMASRASQSTQSSAVA